MIVKQTVPLHRLPTYTAIVILMFAFTNVAGPLLGGVFTDKVTWRWCFYINLPFGVVASCFILLCFTSRAIVQRGNFKEQIRNLNPEGNICFLPGIICLLLALQWGGSTHAWNSGRIIDLFAVFGMLVVVFVAIQH
jgi:MFS family permease